MSPFALALVLASALAHATWNLYAKRASAAGVPFLWLSLVLATLLYAPLAALAFVVTGYRPDALGLLFVAVNAALNVAYFVFLQRGYRSGDLSVVYPLARGSGPVLATAAAIALFGERPTPLALGGALAIAGGVVILMGDPRQMASSGARGAVGWALLTGATIAAYTLWDRRAVGTLLIPPLLYDWLANVGRWLILTPAAARRPATIGAVWAAQRQAVLAVAALSPLAYILVLTALAVSPVSYVAPAREIGILFGSLLGTRTLAEAAGRRRTVAALVMVGGVVALGLG